MCSSENKALYFEFPTKAYIKTDESAKIYEDLWSLVPEYVKCCREEAESNQVTVGADSNDQKNYIIDKVALFKPNETPPEVIDGTLQLGSSFLICL